jgi:signal transduction histidine kinase
VESRPLPEPPEDATVDYVSLLSHVLMTPLAGIVLWCDMLLRKQAGLPELAERGIVAIDRSARAQVAILDNLVELARLQARSTELERSRVDVGKCIEDVLVRAATAAKQRQLNVRFARPAAPCFVQGDPVRLRTALHNVLDNAINASPVGGVVDIDLRDDARGVSIRVTDEGAGIAPEALPGLFTVGAVTGVGLAGRRGGLGLGLPIAQWIAELHGGSISVGPLAPRGTRLAFELPAA